MVNMWTGPLVATYTKFDLAVCRWYPKASFLARADQSASTAGRWGGMGEDGFQAVPHGIVQDFPCCCLFP